MTRKSDGREFVSFVLFKIQWSCPVVWTSDTNGLLLFFLNVPGFIMGTVPSREGHFNENCPQWSLWNMQSNQDTSWKHTLLLSFSNAILDKQNSFKPPRTETATQASHTVVSHADSQTVKWYQGLGRQVVLFIFSFVSMWEQCSLSLSVFPCSPL